MLRIQIACAAVTLSLVCGCGGMSKPDQKAKSGPNAGATGNNQPGLTPTEPELVAVPDQTEPGDTDFPRGAEAFAALVKSAETNDADGWTKAEARLHELGAEATAALAIHLADKNTVARELAAMFLAQIGPEASSAAKNLLRLLNDESSFARVNAAAALSTFDGYADEIAPVLTGLLEDADESVRLTATTSLRNVGSAATISVNNLIRGLNDPSPQVRAAAATTLAELGPAALKSLPALRQLRSDTEEAVATAATQAIRRLNEVARDSAKAIPVSATRE